MNTKQKYSRLNPLNDFIFKKLFGEKGSEPQLLSFLNAVLAKNHEEPLTEIEIIDNLELSKEFLEDKAGRIDVRARTKTGYEINVEVQLRDQKGFLKRMLFYDFKLYLEGIKRGEGYDVLKKVISINLLDFEIFPAPKYYRIFRFLDLDDHHELSDLLEIHFIEMPKFRRNAEAHVALHPTDADALQRWLLFFEEKTPRPLLEALMELDTTIKNAEEKLTILSQDEKARRLYEFRENSAHERANLIATGVEKGVEQGRAEGMERGIEKGVEQGIEKGIEQGRKEGITQGMEKGELIACKRNAKGMKDKGLELSLIAEITGLSLDEIEAL